MRPAWVLLVLALCSCGWMRPAECDWQCARSDADAGCVAGPPMCTAHCGGPSCPSGYTLTPDAGHCGPMPSSERTGCL